MIATSHATNAGLTANLPYHPTNSFATVALMASVPQVLVVGNNVPAKSVTELIALAKVRPGKLNFGSGGTGAATHLVAELFKSMANVNIVHVAYKGVGFAIIDIIGGQIEIAFSSLPAAMSQIRTNRVRALAVTSARRSRLMPELPTIAEAGVPGYEATQWFGMLAPAGTPRPIIDRLNHEMDKLLKSPEVRDRLIADGTDPAPTTPEEFGAYIKSETEKWTKVIKAAGIKPQ